MISKPMEKGQCLIDHEKLGIDSTALGFKAGFTGNYIEDYLHQQAIQTDFIPVPGFTRINVLRM